MNKVKTALLSLALAVSQAVAGTPAAPTVPAVTPAPSVLDVTAKGFAAIVLNDGDESVGGGLSLEAALTDSLSVEVFGTVLEDEVYGVGANLLYYVPVFSKTSVYGLAGGAYDFESDQWAVRAGGGVSYAVTETVNLFADAAYNFTVEDSEQDGVVSIRAGFGFKF
jgi:hypothetical protein